MPNASGTRFSIDLKRCRGPIRLQEGFTIEALMHIVENAGMKVLHASVTPFPDGTVNGHLDLSESHFSFGTYRKGRGFSGELNICNENEENLSKGRRAVKSFRRFLKPKTADIKEDPWSL